MTNTKKQLMTAIAMLVVAALALGASTYAWFMSNTTVSVESMTFTAQSTDNLQIALTKTAWGGSLGWDGAEADAFKTIITTDDLNTLYTAKSASLTGPALIPASTINAASNAFFRIPDDENGAWTTQGGVTKAMKWQRVDSIAENSVKAIPLYVKSTSATALYIGANTSVTGDAAPAARVAFVVPAEDGLSANTIIWAPNTNHITDSGITTIDDANGIAKAVKDESTVGDMGVAVTEGPLGANTKLADLKVNTARRIMVYIWLEGCDEDCVSGLSAKDLTVNLAFTSKTN